MSKTLAPSRVTARDRKGLKFVSIVESAYNKAGLSEEEAQCVNDTPGLAELVTTFIDKNRRTNRYANEEVPSRYVYPPAYHRRVITEQTNRLRELIPGAGFADEKLAEAALLPGAEGHFAILRWQSVAPTYGATCEKLLDLVKKLYGKKFTNWLEGKLGPEYLRQSQHSIAKYHALGEQQTGYDILVVQGQMGLRHAGCSPRRADERFLGNEFGLGLFGNLCIILTHPERLSTGNELWIDCTGDEFSPDAGGEFDFVPYLYFRGGEFRLDARWAGHARERSGSSSGFLPPSTA